MVEFGYVNTAGPQPHVITGVLVTSRLAFKVIKRGASGASRKSLFDLSMNDKITRLFSSTKRNEALSLRQSAVDPTLTTVHLAGNMSPLFSTILSPNAKPDVIMFQGFPRSGNKIATATFSSLTTTTTLSIRGYVIHMKMSQLSGNFTLEYSTVGTLKWKLNHLRGSTLELFDSSGHKLARIKSAHPGSEDKKLEILTSCDSIFLELIILSATVAKTLTKLISNSPENPLPNPS